MKITDLINEDLLIIDHQFKDKNDVIDTLAKKLEANDLITDLEAFKDAIKEREKQSSTGIGMGIAIPHAKSEYVKKPSLIFAKAKGDGVDFESVDETLSDLIFMIAVPSGGENLHLKILQKLSRNLMHDEFTESLREAKDKQALLKILEAIDKEEQ